MPAVFISHSTKDDAIITRLHDELEEKTGAEVWVDHKDIAPGDNWQTAIDQALVDCPYCLVVLSKTSIASDEVTAEWRRALTLNHQILPVIIEDIPLEAIPSRLALNQYVFLNRDWDNAINQLVVAIKGGEPSDDTPRFENIFPITARRPLDSRFTRMPIFGREEDLKILKNYLKEGTTTILGVGGLGKSRLAAELVLNGNGHVRGAVWHRCSTISHPDDVLVLLRQSLNLPPETDRQEILQILRSHKRLIIFDNAEDVTEERQKDYTILINDLAASGAQVLLTSRVDWPGLNPPRRKHTPKTLPLDEAVKIVKSMGEAFNVSGVNDRAAEIAEAALQHPRLIEWAVGQMERGIDRVLRQLRGLRHKKVQEALDGMINITLRQMVETADNGAATETLLKTLTIFRGGFTEAAAHAVYGVNLEDDDEVDVFDDALEMLQIWRFVAYDQINQRYNIDPIVIAAVPLSPDAHKPHYEYYLALTKQHDETQTYYQLEPEADNLEAAFEWAMEAEDYAAASSLLKPCRNFLINRGQFEQLLTWIEKIFVHIDAIHDNNIRANVYLNQGIIYRNHPLGNLLDNLRRAIAAYAESLKYWTPETAPLDYASAQSNLGTAYRSLAEFENQTENLQRAIVCFKEALKFRTPLGTPIDYAATQNNLGSTYWGLASQDGLSDRERTHNLNVAIDCYKRALQHYDPQATPLYCAAIQNNIGGAYRNLANLDESKDTERIRNLNAAIDYYKKALQHYNSQSAPLDYAMTQYNLGITYMDLAELEGSEDRAHFNNLNTAKTHYEHALQFWTPQTAPLQYAMTQANKGEVHEELGEIQKAILCWCEAEKYFRLMSNIEMADRVRIWIDEAGGSCD